MMQNPYLELEDWAFYKHNFIESNPHEGHKGSKMVWGEKGSFALLTSITSLIYHHLFLSNLHVYLLMIQKKKMGQEIKAQTLNSKCTYRSLFHLLAQILQMEDLIFILTIFRSNTIQAWVPRCQFTTNSTYLTVDFYSSHFRESDKCRDKYMLN